MALSRRALIGGLSLGPFVTASLLDIAPALGATGTGQVAGIHRLKVGSVTVTALSDGYLDLDTGLLTGTDDAEIGRLLDRAFLPSGPVRTAVNAYAVERDDALILIDAGGRDLLGPTLGRLPETLAAAGFDPANVDAVYLTHMHPDHLGGLIDGNGRPVFPKAEIVVAESDFAFWTSPDVREQAPDEAKPFFDAARAAVEPYGDRVARFSPERPLLGGPEPIPLPGHTPGHTGFLIEDGGEQLLIWGDIVHAAAFQFDHPDWAIAFDVDQDQAVRTRKVTLDQVVADRLMVAGMHLPFPGFGYVGKAGSAYEFIPLPWQYEL